MLKHNCKRKAAHNNPAAIGSAPLKQLLRAQCVNYYYYYYYITDNVRAFEMAARCLWNGYATDMHTNFE